MLSSVGKESIISLNFLAETETERFSPSDKEETFAAAPSGAIAWEEEEEEEEEVIEGLVVVLTLVEVVAAVEASVESELLLFLESVDR